MSKKVAIVTFLIGESYKTQWSTYCKPNWEQYASRHGYDLIIQDTPIEDDEHARNSSWNWQKCLCFRIPGIEQYDRVLLLDADIVINPRSPALPLDDIPDSKVGAVLRGGIIPEGLKPTCVERTYKASKSISEDTYLDISDMNSWGHMSRHQYKTFGLSNFDDMVQTGVLLLNPKVHREMFEKVYYSDWDHVPTNMRNALAEQVPISHEILSRDFLYELEPRFNFEFSFFAKIYYPTMYGAVLSNILDLNNEGAMHTLKTIAVNTAYSLAYFLHFEGAGIKTMEFLHPGLIGKGGRKIIFV